MAKPGGDDWLFTLAIRFIGLCLGVGWLLWQFFGLDIKTGFIVLLRLILLAALIVGCWKFGDDAPFIHPGKSWPLLLALFVMCWWPALDVWARHQSPRLWASEEVELWWNAWYTELAVLLAGVVGYVVNLRRDE